MVLKSDQDRIRTLLKDTITLLCRNGLSFETEFSIEALIGITLDKDDVFLVSMKELVQSENAAAGTNAEQGVEKNLSEAEGSSSDTSQQNSDGRKRKRRKRKLRVKQEFINDNFPDGQSHSDDFDDQSRFDSKCNVDEPPVKRLNDSNALEEVSKCEQEDVSDESSGEDVTFIKQEMDEQWPQEQPGDFTNFANSLQDPSNLVPIGSHESNALWEQTVMPGSSHMYQPRIPPAPTLMSDDTCMNPSGQGNDGTEQQDIELHPGTGVCLSARLLDDIVRQVSTRTKLACKLLRIMYPTPLLEVFEYYRNVPDNVRMAVENFALNFRSYDLPEPSKVDKQRIRKALQDKFSDIKRRPGRKPVKQSHDFMDTAAGGDAK